MTCSFSSFSHVIPIFGCEEKNLLKKQKCEKKKKKEKKQIVCFDKLLKVVSWNALNASSDI